MRERTILSMHQKKQQLPVCVRTILFLYWRQLNGNFKDNKKLYGLNFMFCGGGVITESRIYTQKMPFFYYLFSEKKISHHVIMMNCISMDKYFEKTIIVNEMHSDRKV